MNLPYVDDESGSGKGPSDSKTRWTRFEVRATVGPVTRNLLAVSQLARSGNSFIWDSEGCYTFDVGGVGLIA